MTVEIVFEIVARPGVLKDGENIFKKRTGENEDCVGMCKGVYVCVVCLELGCVCVGCGVCLCVFGVCIYMVCLVCVGI